MLFSASISKCRACSQSLRFLGLRLLIKQSAVMRGPDTFHAPSRDGTFAGVLLLTSGQVLDGVEV